MLTMIPTRELKMPTRHLVLLWTALMCLPFEAVFADAEVRPHVSPAIPSQALAAFEGEYQYRDGLSLFILAEGELLFAIIGGGKYPLRAVEPDKFKSQSGDVIPFLRDGEGHVMAFMEDADTFPRISAHVPPPVRQLLSPRPPDQDGQPVAYRYARPVQLADGIRTDTSGPDVLPRQVAEKLVNGVIDGTYPDVRSILVYRNGALVLEEYFYGYDRSRRHEMRSLTKSVIALLAGAADDRKLLDSAEPALMRLGYPAYGNPDPRKDKVTMVDLLSNQSGFDCDDRDKTSRGNEVKLYEQADWAKAFVDLPVQSDPGTLGKYCSGGIITAGRVVEMAAGMPLPAFAQEALFEPLGIRRGDWQWNFKLDSTQRSEFGQIYLRPRDMLKLGILIQQRGKWNGRRVISADWIDAATAKRSRIGDSDYGLGIWHRWYRVPTQIGDQRIDTVMLSGNGGQKVYLVPSMDMIVVFTGGSFNAEAPMDEMMARVLLPALLREDR